MATTTVLTAAKADLFCTEQLTFPPQEADLTIMISYPLTVTRYFSDFADMISIFSERFELRYRRPGKFWRTTG